MSVFDTARNMTPPATSKVGGPQAVKAGYSRKTERDNFKIIHVTQFHMEGFLQRGPNQLRTKTKAESILKFLHDHGLARKLPTTKFGDKERKEAWEVRKFENDQNIA